MKRRDIMASEACYSFFHEAPNSSVAKMSIKFDKRPLVGFVNYRFTLEEQIPVLYVYEIQLKSRVQGKGLGKNHIGAVVLTVKKANAVAMNFHRSKLRYTISSISPLRVDPLMGLEKSCAILCKVFDHEANSILEDRKGSFLPGWEVSLLPTVFLCSFWKYFSVDFHLWIANVLNFFLVLLFHLLNTMSGKLLALPCNEMTYINKYSKDEDEHMNSVIG
ncbi:hypothetical protein POTOM_050223 [Populus tomentosa]|uniref:Uncharacterized protein n=1 Tax=Populus tomentosa TaxID=118781 RepID=A0A8X7YI75_POPTO|nr:hypothetical protein POTOM_050223 [Populus tomentosa]